MRPQIVLLHFGICILAATWHRHAHGIRFRPPATGGIHVARVLIALLFGVCIDWYISWLLHCRCVNMYAFNGQDDPHTPCLLTLHVVVNSVLPRVPPRV